MINYKKLKGVYMNHKLSSFLIAMIGLTVMLCYVSSFARLDFGSWPPKTKQRVIFDADINQDPDDVAAITVVHKFADAGLCDIIAMGTSVPKNKVALGIDAFNTYYGRPNIPIGRVKRTNGAENVFQWLFSEYAYSSTAIQYPCNLDTNNIPEACQLYKQVLAQQPDSSVTIIITGYPTNVAQLLLLPGGMDIVRKKVRMVVQMGGSNTCCCNGKEGNFWVDLTSSKIITDSLPVPIVYSGFEVGGQLNSGTGFKSQPTTSPARAVFASTNFSRSSWDPCATLFALAGLGPTSQPYFKIGSDSGYQTVNLSDSSNKWICTNIPGKNPQGFIYLIGNSTSDANLVRVLDSLYALPVPLSTLTGHSLSINISAETKLIWKAGIFHVDGIANGKLELFDESGRTLIKTAIINSRASVKELSNQATRSFLYRLKQNDKVIASGKIVIR
jgi:pyrimidine-specific ribonucleoside hydrolase